MTTTKPEPSPPRIPAYRSQPAKGDTFPTVLVVQEIFGVYEHIRDICRRFAKPGYKAIAPELFFQQGDVSKFTDLRDIISKVHAKLRGWEQAAGEAAA